MVAYDALSSCSRKHSLTFGTCFFVMATLASAQERGQDLWHGAGNAERVMPQAERRSLQVLWRQWTSARCHLREAGTVLSRWRLVQPVPFWAGVRQRLPVAGGAKSGKFDRWSYSRQKCVVTRCVTLRYPTRTPHSCALTASPSPPSYTPRCGGRGRPRGHCSCEAGRSGRH